MKLGWNPQGFHAHRAPARRGATDGEAHRLVPHDVVTVVLSDFLVFTDGPQHAAPRRAVQVESTNQVSAAAAMPSRARTTCGGPAS